MNRLRGFVIIAAFATLGAFQLTSTAFADDKPDPTGTWKWTAMMGNNSREVTLKLKLDGDKLTGAMVGRNGNETKIDDGATFKDGEVSFSVTRMRQNNKVVQKYTGKLTGDTIKGKISAEGQEDRDWEAKRSKD
jgi:hypothetical protein